MPRRVIIKKAEIWKRRQDAYARYFAMHMFAMQYDGPTRATMQERTLAIPQTLNIFGELDLEQCRSLVNQIWMDCDPAHFEAQDFTSRDLINPWTWSPQGWQAYVEAFNNLIEPTSDYQMVYQGEQIFYTGVDKSSTSEVHLPIDVPNLYEK